MTDERRPLQQGIHKGCPYCGHYPEPVERSSPAFVDGDLMELDAATLAKLRGEIDKIDGPVIVPYGAEPRIQGAVRRTWRERQEAQAVLRNALAWWGGLQTAQGYTESQAQRRFYFGFGVDVATAQTLGSTEATELTERLLAVLANHGIDGTIDAALYATN